MPRPNLTSETLGKGTRQTTAKETRHTHTHTHTCLLSQSFTCRTGVSFVVRRPPPKWLWFSICFLLRRPTNGYQHLKTKNPPPGKLSSFKCSLSKHLRGGWHPRPFFSKPSSRKRPRSGARLRFSFSRRGTRRVRSRSSSCRRWPSSGW